MASTASRNIEFTNYSAEGFVAKSCIGCIAEGFANCIASAAATKTQRKGCADGGRSRDLEQIHVGSGIGSNFATSQST